MAVELVTTDDFRRRAFGLIPLLSPFVSDPELDDILADCLARAKDTLEVDLETYWEQKIIRQTEPDEDDDYDIREDPLDYFAYMFGGKQIPKITLRRSPIVSIQRVRLQFSEEMQVLNIPETWWKPDRKIGKLSFVPTGYGAAMLMGSASWYKPLIAVGLRYADVPKFICVDYTAGWYDPAAEALPHGSSAVQEGILDTAYYELLTHCIDLVPTGGTVDGFTQQFADMRTRLETAEKKIKDFKKWWKREYRPLKIIMV